MSVPSRSLSVLALPLVLTCATVPSPNRGKYPSRPRGCKVRVFHTPAPEVKEWDDLGITQVDCTLDVGAAHCLQKLKMEACRLGGDILYDVPKKPLRPTDQGMVYAGQVAHTKEQAIDGGIHDDSDDRGREDQPTFDRSARVEPIAQTGLTADAGVDAEGTD
jgi:hypothetical protein